MSREPVDYPPPIGELYADVVLPHNFNNVVSNAIAESVAGQPASRAVDQRSAAAALVPGQKALRLPYTHTQHPGG